jgi:HlyD family secretion protein
LAALYVNQGDRVAAGELLAQMDASNLEAEVAQAQAQLAQSQAELEKVRNGSRPQVIRRAEASVEAAQATVDLNRERVQRFRELRADGAISQDELDGQEAQFRSAVATLAEAQEQLAEFRAGSRPEDIELAEARVQTSQAQLQLAESRLDDMRIRAPFAGIVTQVYADIGAIVTPTTSASATASATSSSILAIASGLHVEVKVPEVNIRDIQTGQAVEIQAEAYPDETFQGQVVAIAPEAIVEDNVTFFQVSVGLLEGQAQLRSGMNVNAIFQGPTLTDALTVPTVTIATQEGQIGVLLADDTGTATFQPVTVGISQAGQTQILEGLAAGDRIYRDYPEGQRRGPQPR